MARRKKVVEIEAPQVVPARNFQIPGCQVDICSLAEGVPVDQLLSLVFSLASANPDAKVSFSITVLGDG